MADLAFPWFDVVKGSEVQQGDILEKCVVFSPPDGLDPTIFDGPDLLAAQSVKFNWRPAKAVVMSQSCDLVEGREKIQHVVLCRLWDRAEIRGGALADTDGLEKARKGQMAFCHLLNSCNLPDFRTDLRIVDFREIFSIPVGFVRKLAEREGDRLRLQPPYREQLSQAFARFFMRVGLPSDIPQIR